MTTDEEESEYCPSALTASGEPNTDHSHCQCWWDGDPCCRCNAPGIPDEEKTALDAKILAREVINNTPYLVGLRERHAAAFPPEPEHYGAGSHAAALLAARLKAMN